jgi:hypothetical protein
MQENISSLTRRGFLSIVPFSAAIALAYQLGHHLPDHDESFFQLVLKNSQGTPEALPLEKHGHFYYSRLTYIIQEMAAVPPLPQYVNYIQIYIQFGDLAQSTDITNTYFVLDHSTFTPTVVVTNEKAYKDGLHLDTLLDIIRTELPNTSGSSAGMYIDYTDEYLGF